MQASFCAYEQETMCLRENTFDENEFVENPIMTIKYGKIAGTLKQKNIS